jgi:hypothetical protein
MNSKRPWLVSALALWVLPPSPTWAKAPDDPCPGRSTELVVDTRARTLHLCRQGKSDAVFSVNLGQGGLDKRRQGDQKTPLGRYRLSLPRASVSGFTWFVPIHYPTAAQKKRGYTGGAIGIHGPPDWMPRQVIDLAFSTPWTDGCIMVRSRAEIEWIRAWLLEHEATAIEMLGDEES